MRRLLLAAVAAALVTPAGARAADPILPLSEVRPGMRCTGLTVVRGLQITPFDVEVLDVVNPQGGGAARILVRVSGPAVDATGLGPGFSGSPANGVSDATSPAAAATPIAGAPRTASRAIASHTSSTVRRSRSS